MKIDRIDDTIILEVNKEIYTLDTLYKCFYWYGANFEVNIINYSAEAFQVILKPMHVAMDFEEVVTKVKRDLVDFKLRDIVTKETQSIRELVIAKAFAYYEVDDTPQSELSDPVGFNPQSI
ncbi:His-Xaa-Ser system protein HxsD (plasmid) [Adhaeribacter swui]|uniref:His-Xaa-Ser system protein HxsD n=1 Tax=Adhaeribacter swui TaxID=2086471 RepID=A0A7G7G2J6_9BACT|nr:His-Xaa-Ser system protein HxsD [Adhaeribacter swui]QNF31380.1 His-Xaa-Ser system protein HxsD [Adhaeribacter swui]